MKEGHPSLSWSNISIVKPLKPKYDFSFLDTCIRRSHPTLGQFVGDERKIFQKEKNQLMNDIKFVPKRKEAKQNEQNLKIRKKMIIQKRGLKKMIKKQSKRKKKHKKQEVEKQRWWRLFNVRCQKNHHYKNGKENTTPKAIKSEDGAKRVIFWYPYNFFQAFVRPSYLPLQPW